MSSSYLIKGATGGTIKIPRSNIVVSPYPIGTYYIDGNDFIPTIFDLTKYAGSGQNPYPSLEYLANHELPLEDMQPYIDDVNNKVSWLWGSLGSGGMCAYSYTSNNNTYYSLTLCQGYITNEETGNIRFLINYVTPMGLGNFPQWKAKEVVITSDADRDNILRILTGNYNQGGQSSAYENLGTPLYENPLEPTTITGVNYTKSNVEHFKTLIEASFTSNVIVNPLIGEAHLQALIGLSSDADSVSFGEYIMQPSIPTGYTQTGSWYGGEDNLEEDPNDKGGVATTGGGGGSFDNNSDPVDFPPDSQFSVDGVSSGLITIYTPTQADLISFNKFLFADITEAMSLVIKRLISDPIEYILSLGLIHLTPSNLSDMEEITFCGIGSGVMAKRVTNQFQRLNCGSIDVNEQFATNLDYSGYSQVQAHIPYCGTYDLDINEVMGSRISLEYIIDLLSGACIANLKITRSKRNDGDANNLDAVLYSFTGNCISQLPLTARDFKSFFNGIATIASGVVSQNAGAIASGAMETVTGMFNPNIQKAGNIQTDYGFMGIQTPYLTLQRPIQQMPADFAKYNGYPSNITVKLGECKGYTKIHPITIYTNEIDGITQEECDMIKELMSEGFWIE